MLPLSSFNLWLRHGGSREALDGSYHPCIMRDVHRLRLWGAHLELEIAAIVSHKASRVTDHSAYRTDAAVYWPAPWYRQRIFSIASSTRKFLLAPLHLPLSAYSPWCPPILAVCVRVCLGSIVEKLCF